MSNNPKSDKSKHADTIIRNHVLLAMGATIIIPVPFVGEVIAVSALQLDMIRQLCRVYDIDFSENQSKAIVSSLTSSTLARAGAKSLIKLVPGLGLVGGVTLSVFSGASTYAVGEVFKKHFQSGGTILDFDTERLKKSYKEKFEKGKKVAAEWQKDQKAKKKAEKAEAKAEKAAAAAEEVVEAAPASPADTVLQKLKELGELKNQGIISDEEFEQMKKKLIKEFK